MIGRQKISALWQFGAAALVLLSLTASALAELPTPEWAQNCKGYVPPPSIPGVPDEPPDMWPGRPGKPMSYKDPQTRTIFYVESNGRHLAAIDPNGTLLWVRDPFTDLNLCPYRNLRPVILKLSTLAPRPPGDPGRFVFRDAKLNRLWDQRASMIRLEYDSSQIIFVDVKTGDSFFGGNN